MPISTAVDLPRRHTARSPDRCAVCGAFDDSIDYEFRDPHLAVEFAERNSDADGGKIATP